VCVLDRHHHTPFLRKELRTAQQNVEAFFRKEERGHAVPQQEVK